MNQIKTVFVGLFYSAIVPTGLIVTAVAMVMLYWVDKYSLLRLWKRPPVREAESGSAEELLLYHIWHPSEARSSLFVRACVAAVCMTVAEAVAMFVADAGAPPLLCPTGVRCSLVELLPQVRDHLHLAAPRHGTNFLRQVS